MSKISQTSTKKPTSQPKFIIADIDLFIMKIAFEAQTTKAQ
jgi:hypothetical protein